VEFSSIDDYLSASVSILTTERVAGEIDAAVHALVSEAFDQATKILSSNRKLPKETAEKLLQQVTLSGNEIPTPVWRQPQEDQPVRGI
jgi:ATP-dependent Zn protease